MDHQLRDLAVLAEDLDSVPSTHVGQLTNSYTYTYSFEDFNILFSPAWPLTLRSTDPQIDICMLIIKKKYTFKQQTNYISDVWLLRANPLFYKSLSCSFYYNNNKNW